jgi:hypothetical protein
VSELHRRADETIQASEGCADDDGSQTGPPASRSDSRRVRSSDAQLTLLPPTIVPMTEEQYHRAVSALAELLRWAVEEKDKEAPRAA